MVINMADTDMYAILQAVQDLSSREPDETKPYEFRYQAAELLKDAIEKCGDKENIAILLARRGLVLLETDVLADAQECVEKALTQLELDEARHLPLLQECYNALGALQCNREDLEGALPHLQRAEALYAKHRGRSAGPTADKLEHGDMHGQTHDAASALGDSLASSTLSCSSESPHAEAMQPATSTIHADKQTKTPEAGNEAGRLGSEPQTWDDVEKQYTSTLFYLAQVHGHAKRRELSAQYCAATLQRQLESGDYQLQDWVQNILQLSGFYVASHGFAIAKYCLLAASQVAKLANQATSVPEEQQCTQQHQQHQQQEQQQPNSEESQGKQPDHPKQQTKKQAVLEPDIAANLELAWAKLYLQQLVASHEHYIERLAPRESPFVSAEHFPDILSFKSLDLPSPSTLPWGSAALVSTFEQARDLFNAGMVHFKAALEYYQLDGWVTEHCNIQMEISNMYRCLASFEPNTKRRRLMHQQRVARLQPLHGTLNVEFFLGLVRSISLELGNVSREILDLEELEGRPAGKVAATRTEAVRYYRDFIDTFRDPIGPSGVLPDRITDDANERYFLLASFSLGRLMSGGRAADRDVDGMVLACQHLRWTAEYVHKHNISQFTREASMAQEMALLITEKIDLTRRISHG